MNNNHTQEKAELKESKINESLLESITDDLIYEDRGAEVAIKNSKNIARLINKDRKIIPVIGAYMQKKKDSVEKHCPVDEKNSFRHGWISILCEIVLSKNILMREVIGGGNTTWCAFDNWAKWAVEFQDF